MFGGDYFGGEAFGGWRFTSEVVPPGGALAGGVAPTPSQTFTAVGVGGAEASGRTPVVNVDDMAPGGGTGGGITPREPDPWFVRDTFEGNTGQVIASHTGETGATWANHGSYAGSHRVLNAERVRCDSAPGAAYASGTPASADYEVKGSFVFNTAAGRTGIAARMDTSADTMYLLDWQGSTGTVRLAKIVAGTLTSLGTFTLTGQAGYHHALTLRVSGTTISALLDGVEQLSVTDSDITSAGKAGIRSEATSGSSTGIHIDSLYAAPVGKTPPEPSTDLDVFLMIGQSNAEGRGVAANSRIPIPGTGWEWDGSELSVIEDPVGDAVDGCAWPAFAKAYYEQTGKAAVVVPSTKGGTGQAAAADSGNGNWDATGTLYYEAVDFYDQAWAELATHSYTVSRAGAVWIQGERDAQAIDDGLITVATYKAALVAMLARLRASYGDEFPFYIVRVGRPLSADTAGFAAVRQAQEEVADADPYTWVVFRNNVNFPDQGKMKDELHYNQLGYNELGEGAATYIASIPEPGTPTPGGALAKGRAPTSMRVTRVTVSDSVAIEDEEAALLISDGELGLANAVGVTDSVTLELVAAWSYGGDSTATYDRGSGFTYEGDDEEDFTYALVP